MQKDPLLCYKILILIKMTSDDMQKHKTVAREWRVGLTHHKHQRCGDCNTEIICICACCMFFLLKN